MEFTLDSHHIPRLCILRKWPQFNGYGFNLHAEKGKPGQFIGKVDDDSPALSSGLRDNDRVIEVNGVNVGNENHQQVVARIKTNPDCVTLLVLDPESEKYYSEKGIIVSSDLDGVQRIECTSGATVSDFECPPVEAEEKPETVEKSETPPAQATPPPTTVQPHEPANGVATINATSPPTNQSAESGLDLNLSAAEMRARLAGSSKRKEVKEAPLGFKDKASLFQQL